MMKKLYTILIILGELLVSSLMRDLNQLSILLTQIKFNVAINVVSMKEIFFHRRMAILLPI